MLFFSEGHTLSQGTKQRDDQRRSVLDNYQHRQGGVHVLRGDGSRQVAGVSCTRREQFTRE